MLAFIKDYAWSLPLMVALIALSGVGATILVQRVNFNKQIRSAHALKVAEMRQAWINNLRDAMSVFQSYGVTPDLGHEKVREFYEYGTRIELMMNPDDPDYRELQDAMYGFLGAETIHEKYSANPRYVALCQKILKREWEFLKWEIRSAEHGGAVRRKSGRASKGRRAK